MKWLLTLALLASVRADSDVLVIGGFHQKIEIIEINIISSVEAIGTECDEVDDFPFEVMGSTAAFLGDRIVVCGGADYGESAITDCLQWTPAARSWTELDQNLPTPLRYPSSSVIDGKWFISGGSFGPASFLREETLIFENGIFTPGPRLPEGRNGHCQITLNDTHVFIAGGDVASTIVLDLPAQEWISLEDLPKAEAFFPACGLVNTQEFGQEVVLAKEDFSYIFSLSDLEWKDGPTLPVYRDNLSAAQLEDGFLAIGGWDDRPETVDTVYKFDAEAYDWILMEDYALNVSRSHTSPVAIPDGFFACH